MTTGPGTGACYGYGSSYATLMIVILFVGPTNRIP